MRRWSEPAGVYYFITLVLPRVGFHEAAGRHRQQGVKSTHWESDAGRRSLVGQKSSETAQYWEVDSGHHQLNIRRIPAMKRTKVRPAGIVAPKSKAHLVRQVASERGISYEEMPFEGRDDLIRFSFEPLDDAATRKLAFAIPREAYAYRAVFDVGPSSDD